MKTTFPLSRTDLESIKFFMDTVSPKSESVILEVDNPAGIGHIITAHLENVKVNGLPVRVSKDIVNENDW